MTIETDNIFGVGDAKNNVEVWVHRDSNLCIHIVDYTEEANIILSAEQATALKNFLHQQGF